MIFVDTSAVYALVDADDPRHAAAVSLFQAANDNDEALLVHSYVISEAADLMRRRLGTEAALAFLNDLAHFTLHWIDASDHAEAVALLAARNWRGLSLVDCASFVVMRSYGLTHGLFFDDDFEREGFALYSG